MPLFCRHNRFEANCPICSRERQAAAPPRAAARARGSGAARKSAGSQRSGGLVTKRLARAADDGYRHPLLPGIKATADAERLAAALAAAAARLEPPGPYPEVAAEPDLEEATWLAFLLALAGPERPELQEAVLAALPAWRDGDTSGLGDEAERTVAAYRAWAARAGSQEAAFTGDPTWQPQRRFARVFDRLALPGFGRPSRFELLVTLGSAGRYELEAGALHLGGDDRTTLAAKRALNSGDTMLLERRAAALAGGAGVPLAALDRGLSLWESNVEFEAPAGELLDGIRHELRLDR